MTNIPTLLQKVVAYKSCNRPMVITAHYNTMFWGPPFQPEGEGNNNQKQKQCRQREGIPFVI
jgi:hypothetical protein